MKNLNYISIKGNNFSGRSYYAKHLCAQYNNTENKTAIYIGEIPSNYISGILPTVQDEINLHKTNASNATIGSIEELALILDLDKITNNNPFSLSGGEQTILVVLCALLLEPSLLIIDTTIEQLNHNWRTPLLNAIKENKFPKTEIVIIDNRNDEYNSNPLHIDEWSEGIKKEDYRFKFHKPSAISYSSSQQPITRLEFQNISFSYNKKLEIFKNLNIELTSGNIFHLQGINGAGKSTFAKLVSGLLKSNSGNILIDGKKINPFKSPSSIASYSFQSPDEQLFSKSVSKEIMESKNDTSIENVKRRNDIIKTFGLEEIKNIHPAELPFVIRKRISLASSLAIDRPWYIIDEPTLGQDYNYLLFLVQVLERLKNNGKGIILISHSEQFLSLFEHKTISFENKNLIINGG